MFLDPDDLAPFATIGQAKAEQMIADAEAMAGLVAPCLADPKVELTEPQRNAVRAVIRGAVLRWNAAGAGGTVTTTQTTAGPWSQGITSTPQTTAGLYRPAELEALQKVCKLATAIDGQDSGSAFTVDVSNGGRWAHADVCALLFGAAYCSCGADINAMLGPLYEGGLLS